MKRKLPVGLDSFKKLRQGNYYYVDKTALIEQVLENGSEVTLFTRPRRFGKSLNISMLQHFFEIGTDPALFDGLHISHSNDYVHASRATPHSGHISAYRFAPHDAVSHPGLKSF